MTVRNIATTEKVEGGEETKLGGRYTFRDGGEDKHVYIYYVEQDKKYESTDKETVVLTPTASWTHELGDGPWQRMHRQGVKKIVLAKDAWNEIKVADEVENFDPENYSFTSNKTGDIVEYLEKPPEEKKESKKKLNKISEKVAKDMSEDNSTFNMFKNASLDAMKEIGADEANALIATGIKSGLASFGLTNDFLESENGTKLIKAIGPLVIHYATTAYGEQIDNLVGENASEHIQEACHLAAKETFKQVVRPALEGLKPMLGELASMGAKSVKSVAKSTTSPGALEEDPLKDLVKQDAKAKVSA